MDNQSIHGCLLDRITDGVAVLDPDLQYTYVDDRAERILGRERTELLDTRLGEVRLDMVGTTVKKQIEVALKEQHHHSFERHNSELGRWFRVDVYPDADGLVLCFRDVTERKEEERGPERIERRSSSLPKNTSEAIYLKNQERRKLQEEHELILKHTEDSIVLVDVEREGDSLNFTYERLQSFSDAPLSFDRGYAQGKTPREVFGDELGPKIEANYRRCVEARGPISYEQEVPYPGGHLIWQAKFAPVIVDGEITRLVGIARNVTERIRQEQELRRKNERLDEFAGVVSHDLRNPLNVALGHTTLAWEALDEEGVESEHLERVQTALDRMESIIMDTLILARRGETVSETEPIAIAELLNRCWEMVDTGAVSLEVEDRLELRGDRERLRHVFENLFRNAVQHGNEVGRVWVGHEGSDTVYVEDDGSGIPNDEREKVFEAGRTSMEEGTGFGLTIVKRIAEAHGWQVRVADGRDGGARFEFAGVEIVDDE